MSKESKRKDKVGWQRSIGGERWTGNFQGRSTVLSSRKGDKADRTQILTQKDTKKKTGSRGSLSFGKKSSLAGHRIGRKDNKPLNMIRPWRNALRSRT